MAGREKGQETEKLTGADDRARLKEERKQFREEQRAQKKEAKRRAKELEAQEEELDEAAEYPGIDAFFNLK